MSELRPFHVAVPVDDLSAAREFYIDILGCREGRSADKWADFDLFGHQFVCHVRDDKPEPQAERIHNQVDGEQVPVPHYGVVLPMAEWRELASRLKSLQQVFLIRPVIRFEGQPGEQGTFFIADPSGNALEFKGLDDLQDLFAR